jgi:hypothetical protein
MIVVNWENEGACVIGKAKIEKRNVQDYPNKLKFLPSATWSLITSKPAFRYKKCNISDIAGMSFYPYDDNLYYYLGFCNTIIASSTKLDGKSLSTTIFLISSIFIYTSTFNIYKLFPIFPLLYNTIYYLVYSFCNFI